MPFSEATIFTVQIDTSQRTVILTACTKTVRVCETTMEVKYHRIHFTYAKYTFWQSLAVLVLVTVAD